MCGRFTLTRQNRRELAQLLGVDEDDLRDYRPRYIIAPTDPHFKIRAADCAACDLGLGQFAGQRQRPGQPMHQRQSGDA